MKKRVGSGVGSGSGSISQRYGSGDPDPNPHQNVTDRQHCSQQVILLSFLLLQFAFDFEGISFLLQRYA